MERVLWQFCKSGIFATSQTSAVREQVLESVLFPPWWSAVQLEKQPHSAHGCRKVS